MHCVQNLSQISVTDNGDGTMTISGIHDFFVSGPGWNDLDNSSGTTVGQDQSSYTVPRGTYTLVTGDGCGSNAPNYQTITPPAQPTVSVTGISLNQTSLTKTVDDADVTLTATISPADATNKNVSWTTSNSSVATVNNGTVSFVGAGSAVITVTTQDGNYQATCNVTVNAASVSVTGISLNQTTLTLEVDSTAQLTATVTPDNANNKTVAWSSSDNSIATVSNGLITGISEGTATITATTEDGGYTAFCNVTVDHSHVGIQSPSLAAPIVQIRNGYLYVNTAIEEYIQIYSVTGQLLYSRNKPAGEIIVALPSAKGQVLVIKGSSGWIKRVM